MSPSRWTFAIPGAVLAAAVAVRGADARVVAALLAVDVAVPLLPWRVPRRDRSGVSYWAESIVPVGALTVAAAISLAGGAAWAALPHPAWLLAGGLTGIVLLRATGTDVRSVLSGDLAALLGPDRPSHACARGTAILLAPFAEEAVFRGVAPGLPGVDWSVAVLALLAFVGRHHVVRGLERRATRRILLTETSSGLAFLALAAASGSIWPAVVAHALNNLPFAVLEFQQARPEESFA